MNFGLQGKKGLVVGIANDKSIAWGCARAFRAAGADVALTWFNDRARPHLEPLAQQLQAAITLPLDVEQPGQLQAVFKAIDAQWGWLDFVLHAIAFAPKSDLHGRVADSSREGFARAMDISCHSFARMVRRTPLRRTVDIAEVGALCVFLASDAACAITGGTLYVDAGFHIL